MLLKCCRILYRWGPVPAQMSLIFYFSSRPSGSPVLEKFPLPFALGHYLGYALLGFLLYRALAGDFRQWGLRPARWSLAVGVLYAISDEFHQVFVPGRQSSVADVIIDGLGIITSLILIRVFMAFRDAYYGRKLAAGERDSSPG